MRFIADLHIHSRFSRATSSDMDIPAIARAAKQKGIRLVATGDFTHPEYFASLSQHLKDGGNGLYLYDDVHFIINTEVNNIYSWNGRLRRVHNLIFVPSLESAARVAEMLAGYGKLDADGRPSVSISCRDMVARILELEPRAFVVPAHIWTPWFSLYGSNSGFDSFADCFGDLADEVFAVETGLSSDPPMNWRLSELDKKTLISNSDAHSPSRLGREANVFDCDLNYDTIREVLKTRDKNRLLFTIEFFPEEGKYHYDGHRNCGIRLAPGESTLSGDVCPVCGRKLTIGVLHRVEQLADRKPEEVPKDMIPFKHLVPLEEIIAEALEQGRDTAGVARKYEEMINGLGPEFEILMDVPVEEIARFGEKIAEGIDRMRRGEITVEPGFDGVFGTVQVLPGTRKVTFEPEPGEKGQQLRLFG
ncbi:MAG: endonuclease Q family protein [candidate division WOR-3 bacterium]